MKKGIHAVDPLTPSDSVGLGKSGCRQMREETRIAGIPTTWIYWISRAKSRFFCLTFQPSGFHAHDVHCKLIGQVLGVACGASKRRKWIREHGFCGMRAQLKM